MNIYPQYVKDAISEFNFLTAEFGFVLTTQNLTDIAVFLEFHKGDRSVKLGYEIKESRFFYSLRQAEKMVMFHDFFQRHDKAISWPVLMPRFDDYKEALEKNARLLRKYGEGFLSCSEDL